MIPPTETFTRWLGTWFGNPHTDPERYVAGVDKAASWADDPSFTTFRDELAAHIRESSFPVGTGSDRQWTAEEELRDVYYDVFGPEPAPGDPYPVDRETWGRHRLTAYMLDGIGTDEATASDGAARWLAARGLTLDAIVAGHDDPASTEYRPEPAGYQAHLDRLTRAGRREAQDPA